MSEQILSWMMDEFMCLPKPYLLLSTTCDVILPWMIEFWMKNNLLSDSNCITVDLYSHPKKQYIKKIEGVTNNGGLTCSVGDTTPWFPISNEQYN